MSELRDWLEEIACRAGLDGLPRPVAITCLVLAAALLAVAVWRWGPWAVPDDAETAVSLPKGDPESAEPSEPDSLTVHVVGAVVAPGVFSLPAGSRACDAVAAAGGLRSDAEASAVNLARVLGDGEQVVIPLKGAVPEAGTGPGTRGAASGAGGISAGGKVNLNTGGVSELDSLPGVGPATAEKIIRDREENGPFRRPEDLMRVPGIGTKRFEALKDLVTTG